MEEPPEALHLVSDILTLPSEGSLGVGMSTASLLLPEDGSGKKHRGSSSSRSYFTRSTTTTEYKAAGVLPLALHNGEAVVLLGAEQVRTGPHGRTRKRVWRDFGGGREAVDEDVEATAAREFAEETLGLFAGCAVTQCCVAQSAASMARQLRNGSDGRGSASGAAGGGLHVVHPLKKGCYHMFIALVPYIDPLMFQLATQQNLATQAVEGAEKHAFAWVNLRSLLAAVGGGRGGADAGGSTATGGGATLGGSSGSTAARRRYSCAAATACGRTARDASGRGTRPLRLHPCFACSVRQAARSGGGPTQMVARAVAAAAAAAATGGGSKGLSPMPPVRGGLAAAVVVHAKGPAPGGNDDVVASVGGGEEAGVVAQVVPSPDTLLFWVQHLRQQQVEEQAPETTSLHPPSPPPPPC